MDKFQLFYEEIQKISLSENPISQTMQFKSTQDNLQFSINVLHQLVSLPFLGHHFNIESLIQGLKKLIEVQALVETQPNEKFIDDLFVKAFSNYFQHIDHLSHVLRFAPPHIKKLQLALLTEVLLKQDHEHHETQISNLSNKRIKTIIQQSLQYSSEAFNYQVLIHRCIFELLKRSVQEKIQGKGLNDYQNWLANFSYQIDKCLKYADLKSQSILDGLEQFEHQGKTIKDLFEEAEGKFSVNLSFNQPPSPQLLSTLKSKRNLLEKLKFGQERRYDYFQKICHNTINDYLSVSKNLKEIFLADNHLSDETFINLSRRNDLQRFLEIIHLQNQAPFSAILLVGELMGIKFYNVGKLKANLALKNYPFPNLDKKDIQEFISTTKQLFKDAPAQHKELKKHLEKAQVIAYTLEGERSPEIKFAVRLNYASSVVLNFCLDNNRFPSEEEIATNSNLNLQCLTIRDSKNLDEAVIQNAIRSRESLRIKEMNQQRAMLQEEIQTQKKAQQLQQQVQYRLKPLEEDIQKLETLKQAIKLSLQKQLAKKTLEQTFKAFSDNQKTISSFYLDLKTRQELIEVLVLSLDQKLQHLVSTEKQLKQHGGIYQATRDISILQLQHKQQQEQIELHKIKLILSQLEPFIPVTQVQLIPNESLELPLNILKFAEQLIQNHKQLHSEILKLQAFINSEASLDFDDHYLRLEVIEHELNEKRMLRQHILSILPNSCYQEFQQLEELEHQFKIKSEQLIDKRSMFAAFKDNFPALKISEIGFCETEERCFRKLLELYTIYQEARLLIPPIITELFLQLEQNLLHEFKFPHNLTLLEQQLDKLFKTISAIPIDNDISAHLEFSIKRQKAITNEQLSNQNISIIKKHFSNLLTTSSPQAIEQIKQSLQELFVKAFELEHLAQLDVENISPNKIKHDIQMMLDNLLRIAKAVLEGKSFISHEEEAAYIDAILTVATYYDLEKQLKPNQYLPKFETLSFKIKHSQCIQHINFFDEKQLPVITIPIELKTSLPYSLRKFPMNGYFLSYGGSRGVIYQAAHANKRLMTNNRLIGHGQYGSVFQASDLFMLTEIAFKQVVTSPQAKEVFDPSMQHKVGLRAIYARPDNLNQDEELINYAFNQAMHIAAPNHPVIQDIKPGLYLQDARAKKISGAQNLALGESLADLSAFQRQNLSKEMQAYHNPCLRTNFDLVEQITIVLSQAYAVINAIEKYHHLGFVHGDIKPENIMLYKKPGNRYEASLIDKATSAFQRPYFGKEQDLTVIFQQLFSKKTITYQQDNIIESQDGYYVKIHNQEIVFGKKALLQITFGSRNCTLPFIAPCMIDDPKTKNVTVMTYDNPSMDNWAATVLLFGICHQKNYFNLVEGRIVSDYRVPGILKVTGYNSSELSLEIESLALFNSLFACEKSESVMFVPSNFREGEPWHLYRYLSKMSDELDKKPQTTQVNKIQRNIQDILDTVYSAVENGIGLTLAQLKNLLFQIDQCKTTYEKIIHSQTIAEPINEDQQFEKAIKIIESNQPYALRIPIDEQYCVLDVLCLNAKTIEQISQSKLIIETHQNELMDMFIGPHAICDSLLQQCVAIHHEDILLYILDKIKQHPYFDKLIEKTQLLRQIAQENLTKVFLVLNQAIPKAYPTPFIKWNKSCLEFAIDNHNPEILTAILSKTSPDKHHFLEALRRCALNDNINFYHQILQYFNQQSSQTITDEDILNFHPISAFHIWMTSSKNWRLLDQLSPKNLNQLLTSPENIALFACQFENLYGLLHIIKTKQPILEHHQWQKLICNRDLENKSVLHHALEKKEKTTDITALFSYIQTNFGEQQIIELLLQEPYPKDFHEDIIKALLAQTKGMPLQQMAIIISSHRWFLQQRQTAQNILEDKKLLTPQTRLESLAYLSELEGKENFYFKSILQKYLPKTSHSELIPIFEFCCLFHPKISIFLENSFILQLQLAQQQYQLKQCQQTIPDISRQLAAEDKALFNTMAQLIHDFQLSQRPIASKITINQQTLERLNHFCQLYASPQAPKNLTKDFLDIFDTQELKRLLKHQNPNDLTILSKQFGPIVKIILKSELNASDKLLALEQIQHLKGDLQSHLHQIKQAISQKQVEHFKSNLNEICDAIVVKINNLKSRNHLKAAHRLQALYHDLINEKNQVLDVALFNRCHCYFQKALNDEELKTHRHWLLAWLYKLLGLNKPTQTVELLHTLHEKLENTQNKIMLNFSVY